MSIRAHRVKKIEYAEGVFFNSSSKLADLLRNHSEVNDQTNIDGGGMIEFTLRAMKEVYEKNKEFLPKEEAESLREEIEILESEGKEDDDFIQYDMF